MVGGSLEMGDEEGRGDIFGSLSITGARLELRGEMGNWWSNGKRWH